MTEIVLPLLTGISGVIMTIIAVRLLPFDIAKRQSDVDLLDADAADKITAAALKLLAPLDERIADLEKANARQAARILELENALNIEQEKRRLDREAWDAERQAMQSEINELRSELQRWRQRYGNHGIEGSWL